MNKTLATRTQQRAICPACFNQQALTTRGKLVNHGYLRPQGWHQNTGTCNGAGEHHFGTAAGRDYTVTIIERLRQQATRAQAQAQDVAAGRGVVYGRKRINGSYGARAVYQQVEVENPTPSQRAAYASELEGHARASRLTAAEFQKRVAAWTPVAPVEVAVEAAKVPLVHLKGSYYDVTARACAGSAMAAQQYRPTTAVLAEVTCEKCQKVAAERLARGWPITQARAKK